MKNKELCVMLIIICVMWFFTSLCFKQMNQNFNILNDKLDNLASQTDANINELNTNLEEYKNNNDKTIDDINTQLNKHKDSIQDEIQRIDDDIEDVRQSKLERRLQRKYTQPKVTYTVSTYGLNSYDGVNNFNGHRETYYNLDMNRVVSNAQNNGLCGEYWVREDGCKMFGDKIIVAANQELYPYGSVVETSLGEGIVLDTGTFIYQHPEGYDIATDW